MSYFSEYLFPQVAMLACLCVLLVVSLVYTFRVSWRSPCAALGVFAMGLSSALCLYWTFKGGALPFVAQLFIFSVTIFLLCRAVSPRVWPGGPFDRTDRAALGVD